MLYRYGENVIRGAAGHLEKSMKWFLCFAVSALVVCPRLCPADEFALRDGDTVVFLGDSITAARTYGRIIENYTLLRFPERKVRFLNMGHGGETAAGAATRLDQAVFQTGATVVTVAYGVNDIGWGLRADEQHKRQYLDAIADIFNRQRVATGRSLGRAGHRAQIADRSTRQNAGDGRHEMRMSARSSGLYQSRGGIESETIACK
jgi:hypothetical protein